MWGAIGLIGVAVVGLISALVTRRNDRQDALHELELLKALQGVENTEDTQRMIRDVLRGRAQMWRALRGSSVIRAAVAGLYLALAAGVLYYLFLLVAGRPDMIRNDAPTTLAIATLVALVAAVGLLVTSVVLAVRQPKAGS